MACIALMGPILRKQARRKRVPAVLSHSYEPKEEENEPVTIAEYLVQLGEY